MKTWRPRIDDGFAYIPLSKGLWAKADISSLPVLVAGGKWAVTESERGRFYAFRGRSSKKQYMHRVLAGAKKGEVVDHINGDTLANLRICTVSQNACNSAPRGAISGYKGVYPQRTPGRWFARIRANGKQLNLGTFSDPADAARRYDEAAIQLHGEFAKTNF